MVIEELYKRFLARVGRDERHRSCNSVFHDEISALHRAVTEVTATFAKVEEVRDAMIQLEQANVLTGDSESLMREMANTMELQRKLEDAMEKMVMEMTAIGDRGGYHGGKADPGETKTRDGQYR
ncbi:hypothetical protein PI124_g17323 [Phytophthora idaei]|nr:hypothetical protein PI125_g4693 [Phytophthora idaei]KAG3166585.1 hypothetical protein PI126_g4156 [Phytophthora idaei]KAG3237696.1 hypothetical protein PI124_g17323 [Phytophthora idaei]